MAIITRVLSNAFSVTSRLDGVAQANVDYLVRGKHGWMPTTKSRGPSDYRVEGGGRFSGNIAASSIAPGRSPGSVRRQHSVQRLPHANWYRLSWPSHGPVDRKGRWHFLT